MKYLYLSVFLALVSHGIFAQCSTDSLNISTGYNPLTGTLTSPTVLDPMWTSAVSPDAAAAIIGDGYTIGCYDIVPLATWTPAGSNCRWISGQNYWGYHTSGVAANVFTLTLSRQFKMCQNDSLKMNINFASDDGITNIYLDGSPIYTVSFACGATGYSNHVINLGPVTAGTHTLSVLIYNCNNGYYVNAIGMALNGRLFSTTGHASIKSESTPTVCNIVSTSDSTLCGSISTVLHADTTGTGYVWSTGDTTATITATTTGTYWVTYMEGICYSRTDTVHLMLGATTLSHYTHDTTVCTPSLTLSVPAGYSSYNWSTGSTSSSITVNSSGIYTVSSATSCAGGRIDSFNVHLLTAPTINLGHDTAFCAGNSMVLYAPLPPGYVYTWSTGSTSSAITVTNTGTYWLVITNGVCVSVDSIHINVTPNPVLALGPDTTICSTSGISLFSPQPAGSVYTWSTGSTLPGIAVTTSGYYWLSVTYNGCTTKDTIHINMAAVNVSLGPDSSFCYDGHDIVLSSIQQPGTSYLWNTGATTDSIHIATTGSYWLQVNNSGCIATDTINLSIGRTPSAEAYIKENICVGDTASLALIVRSTNANDFVWNFGGATIVSHNSNHAGPYTLAWPAPGTYIIAVTPSSAEGCIGATYFDTVTVHELPKATINVSTQTTVRCYEDSVLLSAVDPDYSNTYQWAPTHFFSSDMGPEEWGRIGMSGFVTLTVSTPFGCKAQDSVLFTPECCEVFFPTAFTPNGDGKNDVFRPIGDGFHKFHDLRIDNRWGQTVFQSANADMAWDGTFNGVKQDMGTFYYYVKYDCNGQTKFQKGDVTLIK